MASFPFWPLVIYFLPAIVAWLRGHTIDRRDPPFQSVFRLDDPSAGFVALIWAFTGYTVRPARHAIEGRVWVKPASPDYAQRVGGCSLNV